MMRVKDERELQLQRAMLRANKLSVRGLGLTAPNPIVGAVILDSNGVEVASGFHAGKEHAEIAAIEAAKKTGFIDFSRCTLVVTLEPCNHHGKTPPCTAAIIAERFAAVVFAVSDPNPVASGGAIALAAAGIEVIAGIEETFVAFTNRAWLHKVRHSRPWIVSKIAATLDGKVAAIDGSSKWITSEASRNDVARMRNESDAIVTTTATVLADNPDLTPRFVNGVNPSGRQKAPTRVVVGERSIPEDFQINSEKAATRYLSTRSLQELVHFANQAGWNQVMIEAGSTFNSALVQANLVDEIVLYQAPTLLGAGKSFVENLGVTSLSERLDMSFGEVSHVGPDLRIQLFPQRSDFAEIFKGGISQGGRD